MRRVIAYKSLKTKRKLLRADVCKISTRGGKNKIFEKSQKNYADYPRYSSYENINRPNYILEKIDNWCRF